jgi:ADP-heptose:LPS heptosyltransferase
VSFTAGQSDALAEAVVRLAPEAKVISLDTRREGAGHVSDSLLEQLAESVVLSKAMEQMLRSIASRGAGYRLAPQAGSVVIHPGAGKEANRWPAERFVELARRLGGAGKKVRILLGEVEMERWPASLVGELEQVADVKQPQTLVDLVDEIASAAAFVGNDSGPGHLAGILGVPTLSLFGPSDPVRWRPLGPVVHVLRADPIADITVESVYTEVGKLTGG